MPELNLDSVMARSKAPRKFDVIEIRECGRAREHLARQMTAADLGLHPRDVSLFASDNRLTPQRATITVRDGAILFKTEAARAIIRADRTFLIKSKRDTENANILKPILQAITVQPGLPFELSILEVLLYVTTMYFDRRIAHLSWMMEHVLSEFHQTKEPFAMAMVQQLVPLEKVLTAVRNDVRETCDTINRLLEDDELLAAICLTEQKRLHDPSLGSRRRGEGHIPIITTAEAAHILASEARSADALSNAGSQSTVNGTAATSAHSSSSSSDISHGGAAGQLAKSEQLIVRHEPSKVASHAKDIGGRHHSGHVADEHAGTHGSGSSHSNLSSGHNDPNSGLRHARDQHDLVDTPHTVRPELYDQYGRCFDVRFEDVSHAPHHSSAAMQFGHPTDHASNSSGSGSHSAVSGRQRQELQVTEWQAVKLVEQQHREAAWDEQQAAHRQAQLQQEERKLQMGLRNDWRQSNGRFLHTTLDEADEDDDADSRAGRATRKNLESGSTGMSAPGKVSSSSATGNGQLHHHHHHYHHVHAGSPVHGSHATAGSTPIIQNHSREQARHDSAGGGVAGQRQQGWGRGGGGGMSGYNYSSKNGSVLTREMEQATRILETYGREMESIVGSLLEMEEGVDTTRETWRMQLDSSRNHFILVNLWISMISISIMTATIVPTFYGMNIEHGMGNTPETFWGVVAGSVLLGVAAYPIGSWVFRTNWATKSRSEINKVKMLRLFLMQHLDELEEILDACRKFPANINRRQFRDQLHAALPQAGLTKASIDFLFDQYDTNKDGLLEEAELVSRNSRSAYDDGWSGLAMSSGKTAADHTYGLSNSLRSSMMSGEPFDNSNAIDEDDFTDDEILRTPPKRRAGTANTESGKGSRSRDAGLGGEAF